MTKKSSLMIKQNYDRCMVKVIVGTGDEVGDLFEGRMVIKLNGTDIKTTELNSFHGLSSTVEEVVVLKNVVAGDFIDVWMHDLDKFSVENIEVTDINTNTIDVSSLSGNGGFFTDARNILSDVYLTARVVSTKNDIDILLEMLRDAEYKIDSKEMINDTVIVIGCRGPYAFVLEYRKADGWLQFADGDPYILEFKLPTLNNYGYEHIMGLIKNYARKHGV